MKLNKEETELKGKWLFDGISLKNDSISDRIETLTLSYLKKISQDKSGWTTLYQDPLDNRYWELLYENSDFQSGGPPTLRNISKEDAILKYSIFGLHPDDRDL
jgi:hypothetical protein